MEESTATITMQGLPYDAHGYQDTVEIPTEGEVIIKVPFDDFVGKLSITVT